jgi:hypothetical protein
MTIDVTEDIVSVPPANPAAFEGFSFQLNGYSPIGVPVRFIP